MNLAKTGGGNFLPGLLRGKVVDSLYLEVSNIHRLIDGGDPIQRIDASLHILRRQRLRAAIARQQALRVPAHAEHRFARVGAEADQVRGPVVPVEVLEAGRVGGHLDDVGVALRADEVDCFGDCGEKLRVGDVRWVAVVENGHAGWGVSLDDGVFADEDRDIFIPGRLLPVVEEVEVLEEEGGLCVVVQIPGIAGGDADVVILVLVIGC